MQSGKTAVDFWKSNPRVKHYDMHAVGFLTATKLASEVPARRYLVSLRTTVRLKDYGQALRSRKPSERWNKPKPLTVLEQIGKYDPTEQDDDEEEE